MGADSADTDEKPRLLEYYVSKGEASPSTGDILYVLNEKYAAPEVSPAAIIVARHCGRYNLTLFHAVSQCLCVSVCAENRVSFAFIARHAAHERRPRQYLQRCCT